MRRATVVLTLIALLSAGATADARRKATKAEKAAIAEKVGTPAKCLKTFVSTVNERWARTEFNGKTAADPACQAHAANGIVILHRKHGSWRIVTEGSSFECPVPKTPKRIAKDLKIPCYGA